MELTIKIFKNEQYHIVDDPIEVYTQQFDSIRAIYDHARSLIENKKYEFEMWDDKDEEIFGIHSCENRSTGELTRIFPSKDPSSWTQYNVENPDMWNEYEETHIEVYES